MEEWAETWTRNVQLPSIEDTGEGSIDLPTTDSTPKKFVGDWSEGKLKGNGQWILTDGTRYEGQWENSKPSGPGAFTFPHRNKQGGEYKFVDVDGEKKLLW